VFGAAAPEHRVGGRTEEDPTAQLGTTSESSSTTFRAPLPSPSRSGL
jgi:hypothetical protein